MKILHLKLKNINSLAGEWTIDFTDPRFTNSGLFVITGKTGAGKSSILDAIALALYGKTPRVNVTLYDNDVMTRGTTDCYAEIVFETNRKQWKAAWKQERNRAGNLKPVSRQIADGDNRIVADQVRACDSKIVEILGLSFDQFTKVILLAQGSFAAFLQADKNTKGELLEQITGTEIYGEISKRVFERNKAEKEKSDRIDLELGAIHILPKEEIDRLTGEIASLEQQKQAVDIDLLSIEKARQWLADIGNLQKQIAEAKAKLPELQAQADAKTQALEKAEATMEALKAEKKEAADTWTKVRELDAIIAEKDKALAPLLQAIETLQRDHHATAIDIEALQTNLHTSQTQQQAALQWAAENACYEPLTERMAAIQNQHLHAGRLLADFQEKHIELEKTKQDRNNKAATFGQAQAVFNEKNQSLTAKTQALETLKTELTAILAGKELAFYQKEKENTIQLGTQLKDRIAIEKAIAQNQQEIAQHTAQIETAEKTEKASEKTIAQNQTITQNLEKQIELLAENIRLAQAVQSLDEHRRALEEGKPCPLCGATHHPFAEGNIPQTGQKELELKALKEQYRAAEQAIRQDEQQLIRCRSDKANAQTNRNKETQLLAENIRQRDLIRAEIQRTNPSFALPDGDSPLLFLEKIHREKQAAYKALDSQIKEAENCEQQIRKQQNEAIPHAQAEQQAAEKAKTEAETALQLAEQRAATQEAHVGEAKAKHETANSELQQALSEFGVATIEDLNKGFDQWNENRKTTEALADQINRLTQDIALKNKEQSNRNEWLADKQTEQNALVAQRIALAEQRAALFGNKTVADEETRLNNRYTAAEQAETAAEQAKNNAATELAKNKAIVADKENEHALRVAENITRQTAEELLTQYNETKTRADEYSRQIGANTQTLALNAQNIAQNSRKLNEKERQQRIALRWSRLNELIGSQDGRKYRNFAQALTFEHLIGLANRQLQRMSERYLLKRAADAANPFELLVVDKYQNCDERTAQNLSGGEIFIVSLALALGLSGMAGRNINIDTLFIDEGFGSLDSDCLDIAINALASLHSEGKLIGVISHLAELKERIAMHIAVVATGNGHSRIEL
jgi:exonuclease SbcC